MLQAGNLAPCPAFGLVVPTKGWDVFSKTQGESSSEVSRYGAEGCNEGRLAYQRVAAVGLVAPPAYAAAPPPRDVAIAGRLSGRIKRPIEHEPQTVAAKKSCGSPAEGVPRRE